MKMQKVLAVTLGLLLTLAPLAACNGSQDDAAASTSTTTTTTTTTTPVKDSEQAPADDATEPATPETTEPTTAATEPTTTEPTTASETPAPTQDDATKEDLTELFTIIEETMENRRGFSGRVLLDFSMRTNLSIQEMFGLDPEEAEAQDVETDEDGFYDVMANRSTGFLEIAEDYSAKLESLNYEKFFDMTSLDHMVAYREPVDPEDRADADHDPDYVTLRLAQYDPDTLEVTEDSPGKIALNDDMDTEMQEVWFQIAETNFVIDPDTVQARLVEDIDPMVLAPDGEEIPLDDPDYRVIEMEVPYTLLFEEDELGDAFEEADEDTLSESGFMLYYVFRGDELERMTFDLSDQMPNMMGMGEEYKENVRSDFVISFWDLDYATEVATFPFEGFEVPVGGFNMLYGDEAELLRDEYPQYRGTAWGPSGKIEALEETDTIYASAGVLSETMLPDDVEEDDVNDIEWDDVDDLDEDDIDDAIDDDDDATEDDSETVDEDDDADDPDDD